MKQLRWITIVLILLMGTVPLVVSGAEKPSDKPVLIDVRTEPEWNEGHLQGAILIPYEKIGDEIEKVAPDRKTRVILYCKSGRRSGIAQDALKKLGYEDVINNGSVKETSEKLKIPVVK